MIPSGRNSGSGNSCWLHVRLPRARSHSPVLQEAGRCLLLADRRRGARSPSSNNASGAAGATGANANRKSGPSRPGGGAALQ